MDPSVQKQMLTADIMNTSHNWVFLIVRQVFHGHQEAIKGAL